MAERRPGNENLLIAYPAVEARDAPSNVTKKLTMDEFVSHRTKCVFVNNVTYEARVACSGMTDRLLLCSWSPGLKLTVKTQSTGYTLNTTKTRSTP
jgi:hypothetical protein